MCSLKVIVKGDYVDENLQSRSTPPNLTAHRSAHFRNFPSPLPVPCHLSYDGK